MINKIRAYIDHAFKDAPQTKKMEELKEELPQVGKPLWERFKELIK